MSNIISVKSIDDPRLQVFASLTEAQLRNRLHEEEGVFIAESPKVIRVALQAGVQPIALLTESRHITGDAADIVAQLGECPIYTGERELLAKLTGYTLTRGVLCAMRRPRPLSLETLCEKATRIAVIDGVVDTTNIGAIFRSAAALGVDAILITTNSCDPLNRRAVRVSMGTVFLVPWTWIDTFTKNGQNTDLHYTTKLRQLGFKTIAMALVDRSVNLDDPRLMAEPKLAIIMGTEGDGLPHSTIAEADYVVKIPMAHQVDSLNVAAASAVAFWELCTKCVR